MERFSYRKTSKQQGTEFYKTNLFSRNLLMFLLWFDQIKGRLSSEKKARLSQTWLEHSFNKVSLSLSTKTGQKNAALCFFWNISEGRKKSCNFCSTTFIVVDNYVAIKILHSKQLNYFTLYCPTWEIWLTAYKNRLIH